MIKYKCIKCGNGTTTSSHPLIGKCSKGGGHEWVIEDGTQKKFKCIKCGNGQTSTTHPLVGNCSKGAEHKWVIS